MARIVFSAIVDNIRGSIGGTTFQKNAYGYTIKSKPNMVNPNTALQNERKVIMSLVSRSWRDMSQSDRDAYETYASTFPQYSKHNANSQLSGYAVFLKYNFLRVLAGESVKTSIMQSLPDTDTLSYGLVNDAGVLKLTVSSANDDEAWNCLFFMSRPFGSAQNFIGTRTRYIADFTNNSQTHNVQSLYAGVFGVTPAIGSSVAMAVTLIGEDSPYVLAQDKQIYTVAAP